MFAALRVRGEAALVPYFTAGDPDLATTRELVRAAVAEGADAIELGVPFSDPMADGPVLQRSAARALAAGTSLTRVLELVSELRHEVRVPLVLFGYYNPFFRYGVERVARDAAAAGADAFLCVDLPPEEAGELRAATQAAGLDLIALLAPTTPRARLRHIARSASGFLYFVSVLGVTGARAELPA
jgi:tryptophan synthase alpha chain